MEIMQILVRVVDRDGAVGSSKRGDVIDIHPDTWVWSEVELNYPDWRIIRSPLLESHADILMQGALEDSPDSRLFRSWSIDFSKLPDPDLFSGVRGGTINLENDELVGAVMKKVL